MNWFTFLWIFGFIAIIIWIIIAAKIESDKMNSNNYNKK